MKNSKTTKRVLFTNIISLVMCVAMLMGTTFAWFTDNSTTKVNTIKAGKLDVALMMYEGNDWQSAQEDEWVDAEGKTLSFKVANTTATDLLWEPGATFEIPALKIVNKGTLALKFKVMVTGVTGDADLAEVIDVYKVETNSSTKIGTLSELMNDNDGAAYGNLIGGAETPVYKLAFKMQETAGNMYQEKSIENIAVTLVATQDTVEFDSYYNTYDKDAEYPIIGTKDLQEAIKEGKNVNFTSDVNIKKNELGSNAYGVTGITQLNGGVIDGNGYTLSVKSYGTWDSAINTTGGTIKNLIVDSGFRGIFINHNSSHSEPVILEDVIIDGPTYTISCDQGTNSGLTATNSTFNGWTSYAATIGDVEFVNCNFGEGSGYKFMRPYAKTTLTNCNFSAGYEIDSRAATTLIDCKLDGVLITEENLATLVTGNIGNVTIQNTSN